MDLAQAFIFDAGWFFFAVWTMVLVTVNLVAFGRDILGFTPHRTRENNLP